MDEFDEDEGPHLLAIHITMQAHLHVHAGMLMENLHKEWRRLAAKESFFTTDKAVVNHYGSTVALTVVVAPAFAALAIAEMEKFVSHLWETNLPDWLEEEDINFLLPKALPIDGILDEDTIVEDGLPVLEVIREGNVYILPSLRPGNQPAAIIHNDDDNVVFLEGSHEE